MRGDAPKVLLEQKKEFLSCQDMMQVQVTKSHTAQVADGKFMFIPYVSCVLTNTANNDKKKTALPRTVIAV